MIALAETTDILDPHVEGWIWWVLIILGLFAVLLVIGILRRRLVQPMRNTPSDTTDSWKEAGRRMTAPPATEEDASEDSGQS
jgi:hypothetical protein